VVRDLAKLAAAKDARASIDQGFREGGRVERGSGDATPSPAGRLAPQAASRGG
jgi:hypothetical protein